MGRRKRACREHAVVREPIPVAWAIGAAIGGPQRCGIGTDRPARRRSAAGCTRRRRTARTHSRVPTGREHGPGRVKLPSLKKGIKSEVPSCSKGSDADECDQRWNRLDTDWRDAWELCVRRTRSAIQGQVQESVSLNAGQCRDLLGGTGPDRPGWGVQARLEGST